ncbi:MAG: copper resistance protein CopC [Candidatus Paceibacterota bacterium]
MKQLLLFLIIAAGIPAVAFAHATPVDTMPASGEQLDTAPEHVSIRFSERLESGSSNIRVVDASDQQITALDATVDPDDPHRLTVPLPQIEEGTFIVSWSVVSADDGHFTKGSYAFSVGSGAPVTTATELSVVTIAAYPEIASMFIEFLGNSLLWGMLVLFVFAIRPVIAQVREPDPVRRLCTQLLYAGFGLVLVGGVLQFFWKTYELAGLHEIAFLDAMNMYAYTMAGSATLARLGVVLFGAVTFTFIRRRFLTASRGNRYDAVLFGVLLVFAYLRSTVSHATANPFHPEFSVFINTLHLIEKDLWLGILLVLVLLVALRRSVLKEIIPRAFAILSVNFILVAVTASYIIWLHLKSFSNIRTTEWGTVFTMLAVSAGLLVGLRVYHVALYRFRPRLFARWFKGSIAVEAGCAILVVWFSSQIIITSPPLPALAETLSDGDITLTSSPFEDDTALITVPTGSDTPTVIVGEADGGLLVDVTTRFANGYTFPLELIKRDTTVHVIASQEAGYDARAAFAVTEDTFAPPEGHGRTFDLFTILMFALALFGVAAGVLLVYLCRSFSAVSLPLQNAPFVAIPLFLLTIAVVFVLAGWASVVWGNEFKQQCEADGNYWHLMQPTKAGRIVSQTAQEGCMLSGSQYQFADVREYTYLRSLGAADVSFNTDEITAGVPTELLVAITEDDGTPAVLSLAHDKFLHMVIVGKDMDYFAHIHPEDDGVADVPGAQFSIAHTFPEAGTYIVAIDYLHGLTAESRHFLVEVSGGPEQEETPRLYDSPYTVGPYEVGLSYSQPFVNEEATLLFDFTKDGKPVYDLEPYLAAAMHLAVVKHDLSEFIHTHGEVHRPGELQQSTDGGGHNHAPPPLQFGPSVEAHPVFPSEGLYTVFGEFKHEGEVRNVRFTVRVE